MPKVEWRLFFKGSAPAGIRQRLGIPEDATLSDARTDTYFNCGELLGLKLRGEAELEAKVRKERDELGGERYEKFSLPGDLLQGGRVNTSLLTALLVPDHTDPATAAEITEQSAGPRGGEQVPIQKQVIKASEKPTVEFSELVVQSAGEAVKYDTICVEGKEKAVHEFIRDKELLDL
eukprot:EG_transcript_35428